VGASIQNNKFYSQFNNNGSMLERKRHRPSSVRSPENTEAVRVALQRSPSKSTRKAAAQLGISRRSVQRILESDLNLYPYKLTVQNKHQRMTFSEWAQNAEISFNNVWFSDEAHFHLDGVVNKQNVRFWASENPRMIHEKVHHAPRITVWVTISGDELLGPIFFEDIHNNIVVLDCPYCVYHVHDTQKDAYYEDFFEETVNSERYLSMLRDTFVPHLLATGLPLRTQWFMQD
jgi:hypothetical protein